MDLRSAVELRISGVEVAGGIVEFLGDLLFVEELLQYVVQFVGNRLRRVLVKGFVGAAGEVVFNFVDVLLFCQDDCSVSLVGRKETEL